MSIETVGRVTKVASDVSRGCEHCGYTIEHTDLAGAINHYISEHNYRLFYIGAETAEGYDGNPCQVTIAFLGSDNPPPIKDTESVAFIID